ncbi:MAG: hypothetical protein ACI849_000899 [Patiriisocius sp.]|jgi:hypothetical protein
MLTSFFGKSSPINYILLSIAIVLGYFLNVFLSQEGLLSLGSLADHVGTILLMVFAVLLLDFIIRKNNVTKNNTFAILLFVLFVLLVPQVYKAIPLILANVFLLLSTRRMLSLKTEKNTVKKIFDATMYITLASLCYGWAILFFIVLYTAILNKTNATFKYLFIPIIGFLGITTLAITYQLLSTDSYVWIYDWFSAMHFDFSAYNDLSLLIPSTLLLTLIFWAGSARIISLASLSKKEKPSAITMLLITGISVGIVLASPQKDGSELFFLFAPIAAITSNYIESGMTKERFVFNEILIWVLVLLVFIIPMV